MVIEVTDSNFESEVLKSSVPVVVDFWAPWCSPCLMIGQVIEKLSNEYQGKVEFCKLNVDESPKTARKYWVMSIPLVLFFNGARVMDNSLGAVPENVIRAKLEALL